MTLNPTATPTQAIRAEERVQDIANQNLEKVNRKLASQGRLSRRLRTVSSFLRAIAHVQAEAGLHSESPAIITNSDHREILGVSALSSILNRDIASPAVVHQMRSTAKQLGVHQFDGLDLSLHMIGKPVSFDASGAIYLYAPGKVIFNEPGDDAPETYYQQRVREDYWKHAVRKRKFNYEQAPEVDPMDVTYDRDKNSSDAQIVPRIELPDITSEMLRKWAGVTMDVQATLFGGPAHTKPKYQMKALMADLHELAATSVESGGGPFSAAIINPEGKIISFGINRVVPGGDALAHGERMAIAEAFYNTGASDLSDHTLVTSSKNCIGCAELTKWVKIHTVIYDNSKDEIERGTCFTEGPLTKDYFGVSFHQVRVDDDELRDKAFKKFRELLEKDASADYLSDSSHGAS